MIFVADTHVHFYAEYSEKVFWDRAFAGVGDLAPANAGADRAAALFLAERSDCRFFRRWRERGLDANGAYEIEELREDNVLAVRQRAPGGGVLHVFAGRQIVTRERLEILALTADPDIPDGGTIHEAVKRVLAEGAIAVLPWSPGKWLFDRGRIVRDVIERFPPNRLLLGDSALRPVGWGEPFLMRAAVERGFRVIAGTDPLPITGEEKRVGKYGIAISADFDLKRPVNDIRRLLADPGVRIRRAGRRMGPAAVLRRLWRNRVAKTKREASA